MNRSILIPIAWAALLAGCGSKQDVSAKTETPKVTPRTQSHVELATDSPKLSRIKVDKVVSAEVPTNEVTAPGKVELNQNRLSRVVVPLAGRISSVAVRIGDYVKQGQTLFTLESADLDQAISSHLQNDAAITNAKAALTKAQADFDRSKDLFENNAVAKKDVLNAEALLAQAKAGVNQALASSEQSRRRLEMYGVKPGEFGQRMSVRAPISGKVLEMSIVPGEFRTDTGTPVITIADLSTLWLSADVPETSIRFIQIGETVNISLSAYPDEKFNARVTQISDVVDPQTRTVKVRAEMQNAQGKLRPDMYARVKHVDSMEKRPMVPAGAVVQGANSMIVWRETAPGVFDRIAVTAGERVGDRVPIHSGLKEGDRVVVDGAMLLEAQ